MKKLIYIMLLFCMPIVAQNTYFVATDGNDTGDGSISAPWATPQKAVDSLSAGDILYFRGGTYYLTGEIRFDSSGTEGNYINILGYPPDVAAGDSVILDFTANCLPENVKPSGFNAALYLYFVEYLCFKDLVIQNVAMCVKDTVNSKLNGAIYGEVTANLRFERLTVRHIGQKAFWIASGTWDYGFGSTGPFAYDSTFWINCDVYNVADTMVAEPGNGGDAFKVIGYYNNYHYFEGNRAWDYSDDAFDPGGGYRVYKNNWIMSGNKWSHLQYKEGNAFKNSSQTPQYTDPAFMDTAIAVVMTNNIAMFCSGMGYLTNNYHFRGYPNLKAKIYNNVAFKCAVGFADGAPANNDYGYYDTICNTIYRNNMVYGSTLLSPVGLPTNIEIEAYWYIESHNTWDDGYQPRIDVLAYGMTDTVTVTDADFLYDSAQMVALFKAPRQADGSLPAIHPMTLAPSSDLIDAGTQPFASDNAGFTFTFDGLAPDIGAGDVVKVLSSTPASPVATSRKRPAGTATKVYGDGGGIIYEF